MNTSNIAKNASSKPLEGMKSSVQKMADTVETEQLDVAGFFNETQKPACFDATKGSIKFNSVEVPQAFQDAFKNDNPSKLNPNIPNTKVDTETFKNGGYVLLGAVQTGVNTLGGVAKSMISEAGGAGSDLFFNQIMGKTEKPTEVSQDPSKIDPKVVEQKKKEEEYSANRQRGENIEAQITNINRKFENMAQLAPRLQEVADLTGLQAMLSGKLQLVNEAGEIRTDLETSVAQARKKIIEDQQAKQEPLTSTSKQGGQGLETKKVNLANETSGGNTNATNAVG